MTMPLNPRYWIPPLVGAIGTATIGLTNFANSRGDVLLGPLGSADRYLLWGVGTVLILVAGVTIAVGAARASRIDNQNRVLRAQAARADAALETVRNHELRVLGEVLHHASSERISLFVLGPNGFERIARYSKNATVAQGGRSAYPAHQGSVAYAWAHQTDHRELPDPSLSLDDWARAQDEYYGIPQHVARSLRLRSRTYTSVRVDSSDGRFLGVIVFESQLGGDQIVGPGHPVLGLDAIQACLRRELKVERLRALLDASSDLRGTGPIGS